MLSNGEWNEALTILVCQLFTQFTIKLLLSNKEESNLGYFDYRFLCPLRHMSHFTHMLWIALLSCYQDDCIP